MAPKNSHPMTIEEIRRLSLVYATGNFKDQHSKYRNPRRQKLREARRKLAHPRPPSYVLYIQSERWKRFRLKILRRRGFKCQECPSKKDLEVHHLHYDTLGHERPQDVKVLCSFHHSLVDERHMRQSGYAFLAE